MSIRSTMLVYKGPIAKKSRRFTWNRKMNNANKEAASASLAEMLVGVFQRYQGVHVRPRNQRDWPLRVVNLLT